MCNIAGYVGTKQASPILLEMMRAQEISPLCKAVKPLFDPGDCVPVTLVVYEVLHSLMRQGRLQIENSPQPGSAEGLTAPKSIFSFL